VTRCTRCSDFGLHVIIYALRWVGSGRRGRWKGGGELGGKLQPTREDMKKWRRTPLSTTRNKERMPPRACESTAVPPLRGPPKALKQCKHVLPRRPHRAWGGTTALYLCAAVEFRTTAEYVHTSTPRACCGCVRICCRSTPRGTLQGNV
jgi:hypothetical protein